MTGGPAATPAAGTAAPGETQSGGGATPAPAATTAPAPGGTARACDLLTPDEVEAATGFADVVAQPVPDSDTDALSACGFVSAGVVPAAIVTILDPQNTNTDPAGYLALPGSEEVSIPGVRAIWMPGAGFVMIIIKGSSVASVQATPSQGDFKEAATELAEKVAGRL